jgi:hypothetical protein
VREKLDALCDQVAKPGACAAAARFILNVPAPVSSARP